jgi:hypothetical protein
VRRNHAEGLSRDDLDELQRRYPHVYDAMKGKLGVSEDGKEEGGNGEGINLPGFWGSVWTAVKGWFGHKVAPGPSAAIGSIVTNLNKYKDKNGDFTPRGVIMAAISGWGYAEDSWLGQALLQVANWLSDDKNWAFISKKLGGIDTWDQIKGKFKGLTEPVQAPGQQPVQQQAQQPAPVATQPQQAPKRTPRTEHGIHAVPPKEKPAPQERAPEVDKKPACKDPSGAPMPCQVTRLFDNLPDVGNGDNNRPQLQVVARNVLPLPARTNGTQLPAVPELRTGTRG